MIERWEFEKDGESMELAITGRPIVNNSTALVQAALNGIGIVYMVNGYIERFIEEGHLIRGLADWSPRLPGSTLYYADRRRVPRRLRAFIDFLQQSKMLAPIASPAILE